MTLKDHSELWRRMVPAAAACLCFQCLTTEANQLDLSAIATVSQSSNYGSGSYPASYAIDGNVSTFTHTAGVVNDYWMATFHQPTPIDYVELVNRSSCCDRRLEGLVLRFLDENNNTLDVTTVSNPGLGGTWSYQPDAPITAKVVRVGLENGAKNGDNNYYVTLAEARFYADGYVPPVITIETNSLALGKDSFMVRLNDSPPPASHGNDGNLNTETWTVNNTVSGYWEVDLGADYAVTNVMIIPTDASSSLIYSTTLTLFDTEHKPVYSRHLSTATGPHCNVILPSPHIARYARVGIENKARFSFGIKEMFVYGRPASEAGIHAFSASSGNISSGHSATLSWNARMVLDVAIYPGIGSVMALTDAAGDGSLAVAPAVSTTYTMIATNATTVYTNHVAITVDGAPLLPRISEFMASNRLTLKDGNNEASDWIEIFNPGGQPFDLTGYGLSDNPANPLKWRFPALSIPPFGYLVLFASGANDPYDKAGNLHTSWKLSAGGESVVLTAPDGVTTVDSILNYPAQETDLAYGRDRDGALLFMEPTPGFPNIAPAYSGWLSPLEFSHPRGFHSNAFALVISNPNPDSTVLYSLNGSDPSLPYTAALSISGTKTVRARVTRPGYKAPRTQTCSYIFIDEVLTSPVMNQSITQDPRYTDRLRKGLADIPTLCIAVPALPDDYIQREASVELFIPGVPEPVQADCGMVRYGGAYTPFAKKNYRLKFHTRYGTPKLEAPLFAGMDRGFPVKSLFDELELGGGSHDMNARGFYMSARFVEDAMLDMGSLNPHGRFAHLYVNGIYWGQFHLRERLVEHFMADYLGGKPEEYYNIRGNDNVGASFILGTPDPLYRHSWDRIRALQNSYHAVKPYLDVSHLIDFMLLWMYGDSEAEYRAAGPVEAGSGVKFWIADSDGFLRTTTDYSNYDGPSNLFKTLREEGNPDFKTLLADRIYKHHFHDGALTPGACSSRLTERMNEIQDSLIAECARWGYRTPENWLSAAQAIQNNLFPVRTSQQITDFKNRGYYPSFDPPAFNQRGGRVPSGFQPVLSSAAGTIYYTLDGSDPRLPGGGISENALVYSSAAGGSTSAEILVPVGSVWKYLDNGSDQGLAWKERAFNDSAWAAGAAELGYGDGQVTTVSYGPNASQKYITTYFRHAFQAAGLSEIASLKLRLLRDDGAVVYLNGTEVVRSNMPAGPIAYNTFASTAVGGADESTFFEFAMPVHLLQEGENVLAVEIHQVNLTSSDLSFNLELIATRTEESSDSSVITLSDDTVIAVRVLDGNQWSALDTAAFLMMDRVPASCANTIISEIHYNPAGSDDYEFIEIYNCGTNIADFTDVTFAEGVLFAFPDGLGLAPGELLVVAENSASFEERYRTPASPWHYEGIAVAGQWSGALNNAGETVTLLASNGTVIASVPYKPADGWPPRAADAGSSLELRNPGAAPPTQPERDNWLKSPANWQASALYHGSPGRLDATPFPIVISEVLTHTDLGSDWIELHNTGADAVDITGLFLSDSSSNPLKYAIPEATPIPPGGYHDLDTALMGFAFSELGEEAVLVQAAGSDIIRFIDAVAFPAAAREEPFGRYTRSDGVVDFTELSAVTRGAANAPPRVGPVVFSEIMYRPVDGRAEYVELVNISDSTVPLYDPGIPANTWQLAEAVAFTFPPGIEMPPCSLLIVCDTDPATFRQHYGVDPAVPVLGPWSGALNNAGETLLLRRPGTPETDGFVPYYRVDRVSYAPVAPWPAAANSGGVTLLRTAPRAYGNDPGSWTFSSLSCTPGILDFNCPPRWQPIAALSHPAGTPFTLDLSAYASDPNQPGQILSYAQNGAPQGLTLDPSSGVISGACSSQGAHTLELVASDNGVPPLSATNSVALTITEPFIMQLQGNPAGALQLTFPTIIGDTYEVQTSDSLDPPAWQQLQLLPSVGTNWWELVDPDAAARPRRFYRVRWWRE